METVKPTIGIVGGGVVGLSCAVALLDRGYGVSVFERDADYNAASWGNAGHIAVEQVEPLASPSALKSVPRRLFSAGGALGLPPSMARRWLPFAARLVAASTSAKFGAGTAALTSLLAGAMPAWRDLAAAIVANRDRNRADRRCRTRTAEPARLPGRSGRRCDPLYRQRPDRRPPPARDDTRSRGRGARRADRPRGRAPDRRRRTDRRTRP